MPIDEEIRTETIDNLNLDPLNPRLGRENTGPKVSQEKVLELMKDWTLDELALSFLESGFWPQEALLVVEEELYGKKRLVVVEGNRRLAALRLLRNAFSGNPASRKWRDLIESQKAPKKLFERVPYIKADTRKDIEAFLGFRHVTGIKEWAPAEKAEYIARMIDEGKMSYEEVRRKIGSKTPTVRTNYISYKLLLQMEDQEEISVENVEDKFSVLYLSLRTSGAQQFLQIDLKADPKSAQRPVPPTHLKQLKKFALWLFGNQELPPLFTDSRRVGDFSVILESKKAIAYLERTERPNFDVAFHTAGGDESEVIKYVERAADNIELALTKAHFYRKTPKLILAVQRFGGDAWQLLNVFSEIKDALLKGSD